MIDSRINQEYLSWWKVELKPFMYAPFRFLYCTAVCFANNNFFCFQKETAPKYMLQYTSGGTGFTKTIYLLEYLYPPVHPFIVCL